MASFSLIQMANSGITTAYVYRQAPLAVSVAYRAPDACRAPARGAALTFSAAVVELSHEKD